MPKLAPFRDYNEHDVINVYAVSGYTATTATILDRGTIVQVAGDGFRLDQSSPTEFLGNPSDFSPTNVVSQRYGVFPKVIPVTTGTSVVPIGMTLFDVRETDENGELLKFRPRKAAELEAVISGQAMPLVRKGLFGYSGITTGAAQVAVTTTGQISAGTSLYAGAAVLTTYYTTGVNGVVLNPKIGTTLGASDARGFTVIYLNIP